MYNFFYTSVPTPFSQIEHIEEWFTFESVPHSGFNSLFQVEALKIPHYSLCLL